MLTIRCENVGKRYGNEWILKKVDLTFEGGKCYAIKGPNGSGKSTLLKILVGYLSPSFGKITYRDEVEGKEIARDNIYNYISLTAPYIDLIEQYTIKEMVEFHRSIKPFINNISGDELIEMAYLTKQASLRIDEMSSGMLQRLKIAIACFTDSKAIFLDEPGTNLDDTAKAWYHEMIKNTLNKRTVIIASNEVDDFLPVSESIVLTDYK